MDNFIRFLIKATSLLKVKTPKEQIKICMGNVSVDMDSVIGSMTLSYYYFLKHNLIFIPTINCKRSFFPIKLDINLHLKACNLENIKEDMAYHEELCKN